MIILKNYALLRNDFSSTLLLIILITLQRHFFKMGSSLKRRKKWWLKGFHIFRQPVTLHEVHGRVPLVHMLQADIHSINLVQIVPVTPFFLNRLHFQILNYLLCYSGTNLSHLPGDCLVPVILMYIFTFVTIFIIIIIIRIGMNHHRYRP